MPGQSSAVGIGDIPLTSSLSAALANWSSRQTADDCDTPTCDRCPTLDVQHVSGVTASPWPRHWSTTTGYSWFMPLAPYGSAVRPALCWAPDQVRSTRSRPRRFWVWSTLTVILYGAAVSGLAERGGGAVVR